MVCTPTGAHGEVAIEALAAGKHVIIEKPAEVTLAKTDQIIEAQRAAGTQVAVISQHRFDPASEVTLRAIANGELGRITSGIASIDWWRGQSYYDSGDWRGTWELDGGGALMNQGVHTVDLLVAALGQPVEVFAYAETLAHERIETEDVAVGVVRFASGALGVLHGTTAAYPGLSARLQVHGDKGSVVIENDEFTFVHLTPPAQDREEKLMGTKGTENQAEKYRAAAEASATAGRDPGQLSDAHRLAVRELPGRAARRGRGPGRAGREPAVDQRDRRRVRVSAHRAAGETLIKIAVTHQVAQEHVPRSAIRSEPTSDLLSLTDTSGPPRAPHRARRRLAPGAAARALAEGVREWG